ncbi:GMC family oxidoreductase N-terminal domain-containing protein [Nocardioides sp. TRM66260-LWL]|uniref:GMC family oxidoreductase n=1 Tax=Nocardioides sp. TRM66260-LWL TaxID=2874478 RepID=UPI001CC7FFFD|nr:GMC family oxidoreductase N-terminal domain-containing protein [Nocardioides sp. TRM66260-LWL]MBZ5734604.1 GMC family oxidoreductase N-terminal domain-containing protein [Nocardioides sp. TRM66260-LWL]
MAKKTLSHEADYVVVGSGSSGATIAGRLAESGASVIVLEAGKSDEQFLVKKPGMIGPMHAVPQLKRTVDWGFYSVPQKHILDRKMPVPRGKVLGGSSSINGMVYVRGNRANFDSWAAEGNEGWDADSVNAAYKRLEDYEGGANEYRGEGGPIRITVNQTPQEGSLQFLEATAEVTGCRILDDYNGASQEGVGRMQQNAAGGLRYSASRGYIHHLAPPTLEVQTEVQATRVVIENGRAVGVEVRDKRGGTRTIRAGKEVILSAGFVGSAQLLMLSGIGHAQHLKDHGIPVLADLPVGDNLHDHLFHALTFHTTASKNKGTAAYFAKGVAKEVLRPGSTFLANSVFEVLAFLQTSQAQGGVPDLQLHLLPWAYPAGNQDEPIRHEVDTVPSLTVLSTLIYPKSRGTLRLASADPTKAPLIDPQYLAEPEDLQLLEEGTGLVREIFASKAFKGSILKEAHPGPRVTGDELRHTIQHRATSVYHGVGTCRMGVDELAVVDPQLRVRGIEGLRVCDASIMPSITGGNTNAPAYMIGERGADLVLGSTR